MRNKTYVFRGPREVNLLISIPGIFFLGKTNLLFPFDEHYVPCYGSLMGLVGRAICERSPGVVSLKGMRKTLQYG